MITSINDFGTSQNVGGVEVTKPNRNQLPVVLKLKSEI